MKKNFYPALCGLAWLAAFFVFPAISHAQTCSGLKAICTSTESRCMATGTIRVQASGGSGNYNYKVIGPVTTSFTSSNLITGLQAGMYTVVVRDVTKSCQIQKDSIVVSGTYSDPRFLLTKTDVTCAGNNGSIAIANLQYGRAPFLYTIVAPSPMGIGTTSTTGTFTNLVAGAYAIQLTDSCGGIQVRRITIEGYSWWFDGVTVTKTDCNNADAVIHLKDNRGNYNTSSSAFAGFTYGMENTPGDTTWYSSNSFSFYIGTKRTVTFVAKDPCGNLHAYVWQVPAKQKPSVGAVDINHTACAQFSATASNGQNLTNPSYSLFDAGNTKLETNTTGVFSNLPYGNYCIQVLDACYDTTIVRCFTAAQPMPSVSNTVAVSNKTCATFTATITGQTALYNPVYCLYDNSNALISCNSTGSFINLPYGVYCIKITDGCTNAIINRCFTATKPEPVLTSYTITGQNCTSFNVHAKGSNLINPEFCLYDSLGNVVICNATGDFTGIGYGNYCIRAVSCGDTTAPLCLTGAAPKPSVAANVQISNKACSTFTATITGQVNFTSPQYCLFDSTDVLLKCNTTGVFDSLSYGSYCIRIKDGCYDTTLIRCFTKWKPKPSIGAALQQLNNACNTFTAKVTDQKNLFDPQYCIYDSARKQIACNTTGVFNNLPYGTYCVEVIDGCTGDTLRVCQTFTYNYSITLATSKLCTIGSANVDVSFKGGNSPFVIAVFDPADSLVYSSSTTTSTRIVLPGLAKDSVYTIVGTDACGRNDTATIIPDASTVTKNITATGKCPSAAWLNGSGDLHVTATSNLGTVTPKLIEKDGATFSKTHSSNSGNEYIFSDLEPALYVVEYRIQNCSTKLYDTFALQQYTYPTQGRSAIYQCDNKSISLTADVSGGVGPYNYQIIGGEPEVPSIVSAEQASPTFNINTGTTYSLIRLRTVDACGNATLNDVSVLPLQNILISADTTCLFKNITLSVDTIQDATYSWYKKLDETDSVFLSSNKTYNIPFMQQQDIGTYVCKVELNNSCLTRLASFELTGACGDVTLAVPVTLKGKASPAGNLLIWQVPTGTTVQYYEIERRVSVPAGFVVLSKVAVAERSNGQYQFTDNKLQPGTVLYRVKVVLQDGTIAYSNTIRLQRSVMETGVFPNPVHTAFTVQIMANQSSSYKIELHNTAGQQVHVWKVQDVASNKQTFQRPNGVPRGMYLLNVRNLSTGAVVHYKVFFD